VFGTVICDGCTNAPTGAVDGWVTTLPVADGSSSKMQTYNEIGTVQNRSVKLGKSWTRATVGADFSGWNQNYNEAYPQPTNDLTGTAAPSFGTIPAHSIVEVTVPLAGARIGYPAVLSPVEGVTAGIIYTIRSGQSQVIIGAANVTSSAITHATVRTNLPWQIRILK